MFCKNCDIENSDSAKFCKNCGESLLLGAAYILREVSKKNIQQRKMKKMVFVMIAGLILIGAIFIVGRGWFISKNLNNAPQSGLIQTQSSNVTAPVFVCGTFKVVDADDNTYGTIQVGDQCWMASNMKVGKRIGTSKSQANDEKIEKWCFKDVTDNCKTDGGLYTWDEAMQNSITEGAQGICPADWHIPTDAEMHVLESSLKGSAEYCDASRKGNGCSPAGTKLKVKGSSGLDFPLAGYVYNGNFSGHNSESHIWTSTQDINTGSSALYRSVSSEISTVDRFYENKPFGLSVRCIKN